ncbi:uncharacterized protein LOC133895107 [Phragmites australis]|uniref:uncharacterized protein LOC133895107 n=1 Tax=Phragmites australis TaxID=29695 RepID=UPI002D79FCCA|nr:uncharacterized protein LOC133895107 [Phragmites australis]
MSKEVARAAWNSTYEKCLVDILHDHNNNPKFKGQNGWVSEGWRSITIKFNERFPIAHFTKQQLQEKKKELKASYKSIRDAKKQSGTGWDDSMGMIIAEPKIWDKIIKDHPKVRKFRQKPFPLFNYLASLYEGSIATGDLNFISTERVKPPNERSTSEQSIKHVPLPLNTCIQIHLLQVWMVKGHQINILNPMKLNLHHPIII